MSDKHTPGPWNVLPAENEQGGFDIDSEYGYHIAETIGGLDYEEEANARLIAAAPDLLEALIRLLPMAEDGAFQYGGKPDEDEDIIYARAAIAKATGEAA